MLSEKCFTTSHSSFKDCHKTDEMVIRMGTGYDLTSWLFSLDCNLDCLFKCHCVVLADTKFELILLHLTDDGFKQLLFVRVKVCLS